MTTHLALRLRPGELKQLRRRARAEVTTVSGLLRARLAPDHPLDFAPAVAVITEAVRRAAAGRLSDAERAAARRLAAPLAELMHRPCVRIVGGELVAPARRN